VLGADTDVALDGDILGKPADAEQAEGLPRAPLRRTHEVVGGVVLTGIGEFVEVTESTSHPSTAQRSSGT
jgi:septum formation protein